VGLFDLDGFKPVNDAYGHVTGDRVLVEAGCRLQQLCGPAASLARLGGDEFGLIRWRPQRSCRTSTRSPVGSPKHGSRGG
jgi:diguanylate cyclase (GGDEF)-like protein